MIFEVGGLLGDLFAFVGERFDLALGLVDFRFGGCFTAEAFRDAVASLLDQLFQLGFALGERVALALETLEELFLRGERDADFGKGGGGGFAFGAERFDPFIEGVEFLLARLFGLFGLGDLGSEGSALLLAFLVLLGEGLDFEDDRIDFLVEATGGVLQGGDLAFVCGYGDFAGAEGILVGLKCGLCAGLFTEPLAAAAAGFVDLFLERGQFLLQFGDLVFPAEDTGGVFAVGGGFGGAAGEDAVSAEEFALWGDVIEAVAVVVVGGGGFSERGNDTRAGEQPVEKRLDFGVGLDDFERRLAGGGGGIKGIILGVGVLPAEREDTGAAFFLGGERFEDGLGALGILSEDELEVMAQGVLDGDHVGVWDADAVGEGAEGVVFLLECRERAGAEAFVVGLELFEDVEAGAEGGLLLGELVEFPGGLFQLGLEVFEALLLFLD